MLAWLIENSVALAAWTLIVALACRAARSRPALRHALWTLVLVKLLLPPLVAPPRTLVDSLPIVPIEIVENNRVSPKALQAESHSDVPPVELESPTFAAGNKSDEQSGLSTEPTSAAVAEISQPASPTQHGQTYPEWATVSVAWLASRWRELLLGLWLLAAVAMWVRQAWSVVRLQRRIGRGESPPTWLREMVADVAGRLAIRAPAVRVVSGIGSPLIWCCGRPRLLWPRELDHGLNLPWQAIVTHELAHLKRRDHWVGWLELAATCLWWWHPAFWYVRRELHASADLACDAWALATSRAPVRAYAAGLVDIAQGCSRPCAAPALALGWGAGKTFQRRLTMILGNRISHAMPRGGWLAVALVGGLLVPSWSQDRADQTKPLASGPPKELSPETPDADEEQPEAVPRPYVIAPPDVLKITVGKAVAKEPRKIARLESVQIRVNGVLPDDPIDGKYEVDEEGAIDLGPLYARVAIAGLTRAEAQERILDHLKQIVRDPEVSLSLSARPMPPGIEGEHLVGPDGRISLEGGTTKVVTGLTIKQAHEKIESYLRSRYNDVSISVEVSQFNSQAVYVIVETPEGDRIHRQPYTGSGTILDALSRIGDLRLAKGTEIILRRQFLKEDSKEKEDRDVEVQLFWGDKVSEPIYRVEKLRPSDRIFVKRPRGNQ